MVPHHENTPASSAAAAELALESVQASKAEGLTSCDLNFRENLWKWRKNSSQFMPENVKSTDGAIANGRLGAGRIRGASRRAFIDGNKT